MKRFCFCSCYLTDNIFVAKLKTHVRFVSKQQFQSEYPVESADDEVLEEIERERRRRSNLDVDSLRRQEAIKMRYVPKHADIYTFREEYLSNEFKRIFESVEKCTAAEVDVNKMNEIKSYGEKIYSFKVFTEDFCKKLIEEIKHFEESDLPKGRPNSMNNYGVLLNELGFDDFFTTFRERYLSEMSRKFYPELVSSNCGLDSHKIFIVKYKIGQDTSLNYHFDNAEVTLNVSLSSDFQNGELYFGPMATTPQQAEKTFNFIRCKHSPTVGILHRGLQMHEADEITNGERYNLIIWMRSSEIRNEYCPMCKQKPVSLIESTSSRYADGFTRTTSL